MKSIHEGQKPYKIEFKDETTKNPSNTSKKFEENDTGNKVEIEKKPKQCVDYQKEGPKFKCPVCSTFFWSDTRMNYHILQVHEKQQFSEKSDTSDFF